ncbi:MAG: DUF4389 domain-containing protein [Thermoleophilaceae bacterium]|nr:DUF4389 domain-containing protein [Thermoleophilaceae bacterium]
MNDFPEVNPALDSSFALPPDTVAFYADYEQKRSRLTTFFRLILAIPHLIVLSLYGIVAILAVFVAWFALLFTAKYPEGLYNFVVGFQRYATRVNAYTFLVTDKFPPFNGNPDEAYAAHFLIGPPKEKYSRAKTFFRFILIIPFYIVAYILTLVFELVAFVAWLVIVITGKQPRGIQDAMTFCLGFIIRVYSFYLFTTEDWPKFSDEEVTRSLQERGYQGTIPPTDGVVAAAPAAAPPMPPAPPAPPAV